MNMQNKLCIVTGANSGIGKATTLKLAEMGAYVVMICRNEEKAHRAKEEIISKTGNTGLEVLIADFAYQYEIREAAERFRNKFNQLDVLVNNAGMIPSKREETMEGIEKTFAVNHLGPFLLTNLLLDHLIAAPQGRIINVSSEAHRVGASIFHLSNLQLEEGYTNMKAYGLSKLCNIMFTYELAQRLQDTSVTTHAMHPGAVRTNLAGDASWAMKLLFAIGKPFMRSPHKGAETAIYLSTSAEVTETSGKYFKNKKVKSPDDIAYNEDLTSRLWEISEELTKMGTT